MRPTTRTLETVRALSWLPLTQIHLATVRELASAGEPVAAVLLDARGQALRTVPLDVGAMVSAHAAWKAAMTRTLEMTRDYQSECEAELDRPIVIA